MWELGSLPEEHRTDRLSAAVKNLQRDEFTERYQGLLRHFGMRSSRTQAGKAHENGDVEQAHHRLKRAIEQELLLRCSRDFASREEYEGFVAMMVARRNAARIKRLGEEPVCLRWTSQGESYTEPKLKVRDDAGVDHIIDIIC